MKKTGATPIVPPQFETGPRWAVPELRLGKRVDIRTSDGISAKILLDNNQTIDVRVWNLNMSGACLIVPDALPFAVHDSVRIRFMFSWGETVAGDYEVCWIAQTPHGKKIGLKASRKEVVPVNFAGEGRLLSISSSYPITGYLYKPFHYQERSIFRLNSVTTQHAIIDVLDDENLYFEQQKIELLISLAARSERIKGRIQRVMHVTRDSVKLLVEIQELSSGLQDDLVNHLILDPNLDLEKIRKAGFRVRAVADSFRFRFVKTQEEYEQVLRLRLDAYSAAGKTGSGASPETMVAPLDHISRILIALHGGKVIASVAMAFPENEQMVLDTERALPKGYEGKVPPKREMIEIARLCTNQKYRRGDVLLRMFEHIYKVFATSDRKYLISSTDKNLWPIYRNLGFKKIGLKYAHPFLAGLEHDVIMIDLSVPVTGRSIGFLRWRYLYSRMTDFVESRRPLERRGVGKLRFRLFSFAVKTLYLFKRK